MGNSLKKANQTGAETDKTKQRFKFKSINCFTNSAEPTNKRIKQSLSYDTASSTRQTNNSILGKMRSKFKNRSSSSSVQRSKTDQNLLVLDETPDLHVPSEISRRLNSINAFDEPVTINETTEDICDLESTNEQSGFLRHGKFTKSPALYNIQSYINTDASVSNQEIKISDLLMRHEDTSSYNYEQNDINYFNEQNQVNFVYQPINLKSSHTSLSLTSSSSLRASSSSSLLTTRSASLDSLDTNQIQTKNDSNQILKAQETVKQLKFIDESISGVTKSVSASNEVLNSYSNELTSYRVLSEVNKKLLKLQHLKKRKNTTENGLYAKRRIMYKGSACNIRDKHSLLNDIDSLTRNCYSELTSSANNGLDERLNDNMSVYNLFQSELNKSAPLASSENTTLTNSVEFLVRPSLIENNNTNTSDLSIFNSIANLNLLVW